MQNFLTRGSEKERPENICTNHVVFYAELAACRSFASASASLMMNWPSTPFSTPLIRPLSTLSMKNSPAYKAAFSYDEGTVIAVKLTL